MYSSKLPKPVYSDSSLDKLWWSCSAWPIKSQETSNGSLDLYKKYTFSWEATSPLRILICVYLCTAARANRFMVESDEDLVVFSSVAFLQKNNFRQKETIYLLLLIGSFSYHTTFWSQEILFVLIKWRLKKEVIFRLLLVCFGSR